MCLCAPLFSCVCVCVSVSVREKESDSEVSVGGAEAVLGLVGVRYFVDNKYLKGVRATEVSKPQRRGECANLKQKSCTLKIHFMALKYMDIIETHDLRVLAVLAALGYSEGAFR